MKCTQCGAEVADGVKFCPECGAPMEAEETKEAAMQLPDVPSGSGESGSSYGEPKKNNGKAIASLVLGIIAIVTIFTGYGAIIGLIMGVVGIVLGVNAKKEIDATGEEGKGMATAGLVCSIIGTVIAGVGLLCVLCVAGAVGAAACSELQNGWYY